MSAVSFNLANYNKAASEQSRQPTNSVGSFYGQKAGKMVTKDNVKGQCQDKLTSNQLKPEVNPHATTYTDDYHGSSTSGNKKSQTSRQKSESKHAPGGLNYGYQAGKNVPQSSSAKALPNQAAVNLNNQAGGIVRINKANEQPSPQRPEQYKYNKLLLTNTNPSF